MTKWAIISTDNFERKFKKLDRSLQKQIKKWIDKHLVNVEDPRTFGKPLVGDLDGFWRYRIGDYRMIVEIRNKELIILAINIGHRSDIYL